MDHFNSVNDTSQKEPCRTLDRRRHIERLIEGLTEPLSRHYEKLVPAQTWTVYWISHSLALLEQQNFLETLSKDVIEFINECAHVDGGYGGGPGQIAHLATTFAAINALITVSNEAALDSIDRVGLVKFLHRMKQPDGSFLMHDDGEIDSRATYCALAVLRCLNIHDSILLENVADWILSCQTYEGGFSSVPGSEAHGGYTFCCVASLCILNQLHRIDLESLIRWLTNKQLIEEGGFCGRSNKLVDSCYSYWQGAIFPLIHPLLRRMTIDRSQRDKLGRDESLPCKHEDNLADSTTNSTTRNGPHNREPPAKVTKDAPRRNPTRSSTRSKSNEEDRRRGWELHLANWLFDCSALQDYVLDECQAEGGLLRDKPGAPPDFYHTCYALSGLSITQHQPNHSEFDVGSQPINMLARTNPIFNVHTSSLNHCFDHFRNQKVETWKEQSQDADLQDGSN